VGISESLYFQLIDQLNLEYTLSYIFRVKAENPEVHSFFTSINLGHSSLSHSKAFDLSLNSRKLTLATIFGVMLFVFKTFLPSPIDKAFVLFPALLLSLGYLLLGAPGATYTSLIGGLLTALMRGSFAPFTIIFALLYGFMIDAVSSIIKVRDENNDVKQKRLITSVTVSTVAVGSASYYTSVAFQLLPRNLLLEIGILAAGVINGLAGGYLSFAIWKRIFKQSKQQRASMESKPSS